MHTNRPENEEELQKREAIGVIRASRFVRRYAQSNKEINIEVIYEIHKEIFRDAWFEIGGKIRIEDLSITDSSIILPSHKHVYGLMMSLDIKLKERLENLKKLQNEILDVNQKYTEEIIHITSWLHHTITAIHPFREGNGRTARLAANLILERYGLVGISVKIEKENKNIYRQSLAQIDNYSDYEPLENIIMEGISERYDGVPVKYYN